MKSNLRILFIHAGGRRERLLRFEQGEVMPTDFFYGLPELRAMGHRVDLLELSDLQPKENTFKFRWAKFKDSRRAARTLMPHCERLFSGDKTIYGKYDLIIAGTEYIALGMTDLIGRQCAPMLFVAMGMHSKPMLHLPAGHKGRQLASKRYNTLLKRSAGALYLGAPERDFAARRFSGVNGKLNFTPFGIDTDFWTPGPEGQTRQGNVLFVGNDTNRDIECFLEVARSMPKQRFTAITSRLKGMADIPTNLKVIEGHWKKEILTDEQIRDQYRGAEAVIMPINDTLQPSGQSVALQSMACGTPVLISDFPGFWDKKGHRDGENIIFVKDNTPESFTTSLSSLLKDCDRRLAIGKQARELVLDKYTINHFAQSINRVAQEVT